MTHNNQGTRVQRMVPASPRQYLDITLPYSFSDPSRRRQEQLQIGDIVKVRGLPRRYEIMDTFPRTGSVRVREVGGTDEQVFPLSTIERCVNRVTKGSVLTQSIGNWLFRGSRVYRLSEPNHMLKQRRINWDTQTCDVEDVDGRVTCDVPWGELEFWDDMECNLPDDPN